MGNFVVGEFALLVIADIARKLTHERVGKNGDVFGGRVVLRVRQPCRIGEVAVFHAEFLRLLVHELRKQIFRTGNAFGKRNGGIVTALNNHAAQ